MPMEKRYLDYVTWIGDVAHFLGMLAFIGLVVALATPAWVEQVVDTTQPDTKQIVGRGLFQAYVYDGYGIITLYNYYVDDIDGFRTDPFCGNANATFEIFGDTVSRRNNEKEWCDKREATLAMGILTACLVFLCLISAFMITRGWCGEIFYIILSWVAVIIGLVTASILGAWSEELRDHIKGQDIPSRMFPYKQSVQLGYSFLVFVFSVVAMALSAILSVVEGLKGGHGKAVIAMDAPDARSNTGRKSESRV